MHKSLLLYVLSHWRFILHLIFKTRYFGVNNQWWSAHPSAVSWTWRQRLVAIITVNPIIQNIQSMRFRAFAGWVPQKTAEKLFKSH